MSALRGWAVAFLGFVAGAAGSGRSLLSPVAVVTVMGLLGTLASVLGNEAAIWIGRRRLIVVAMLMVYAVVVWLDSASLTAGAAGRAGPSMREATLAVHSMLGYAGGLAGPLMVGVILDGYGGASRAAWGTAFLAVSVLVLLALVVFTLMRPRELACDRQHRPRAWRKATGIANSGRPS